MIVSFMLPVAGQWLISLGLGGWKGLRSSGATSCECFGRILLQVVEKREEVDWKRHFIFVTFGFVYLGGFQYYLYNVKFTQVYSRCLGRDGAVSKVEVAPWVC